MAEPFPPEGLPLEEARARILAVLTPLAGHDRLPLGHALGRVSASLVHAAEDVPGFRAAILDGYAITDDQCPGVGQCWPVVGSSAPGAPFGRSLKPGDAIRILTGAPLPMGCTRVLPQELVRRSEQRLTLVHDCGSNAWIRPADEEAVAGSVLLEPGMRLGVAELGRLAACGVADLEVRRMPRIGLLISGDELVEAGRSRGAGEIWESNGTLLEALLHRLGYLVRRRLLVGDDPSALRDALKGLSANCDVVVSTGGVSAGDSDWIRPLVSELGAVDFWKLFLKPGRPFAFGTLCGTPFFGLPGNPVAAAITALQLLWPGLQRLEGAQVERLPRLKVRLAAEVRRGSGRPELARATLEVAPDGSLVARILGIQASSRIGSLAGADLLLEIPPERGSLAVGTELWAQLLRRSIF